MAKLPEYVLDEDHKILLDSWDEKTLPAGMFVKPLHISYVPKHVFERMYNKFFDSNTHVMCYTSIGIVAIPIDKIRKV